VCTLSTTFAGDAGLTTIQGYRNDNTPESQSEPVEIQIARSEARAKYMELMDLVDETNKDLLHDRCRIKKWSWTTAHLIWLVSVGIIINARKAYQSANACGVVSVDKWILQAINALAKLDQPFEAAHRLMATREHKQKKSMCRVCYHLCGKREKQCRKMCQMCGFVCKDCDYSGRHKTFSQLHHRFWSI
jgi:hypothetical protein